MGEARQLLYRVYRRLATPSSCLEQKEYFELDKMCEALKRTMEEEIVEFVEEDHKDDEEHEGGDGA